ncbi:HtaA domain-containing protein [Streptomyces sp. NBC_00178]|uniref:HtaA domain-containing protein n=1 Tax=Streptomyces sp. NBC_00178 TaxID=2975672 RepID=UPI002E2B2A79|nr:HtaA domain-containing protein [Streptomyces sp. NBC_00178]
MPPSVSARALAVALLAVLFGALLPATAAQAASRTVQGGRLDWGIRSSFQSYVTGPIAQGSWSLTGGAATVGGSQFRFHSATGSYDPASGAFRAGFSGGVHFVGHKQAGGGNRLDLTISRPTVRISGGAGTLHADMVSRDRASGRVTTNAQVPLATLGLSGIDMRGGSTPVALVGVPATLTAQGARAFAGYYAAGTPLDPVSLSVDTRAPAGAKPAKSAAPTDSAPGQQKRKDTAGRFEDAAVDWGVRRTYREYVTGSIGRGRWTLTGGAQDGGALFRFPRGEGTYDAARQELTASFAGSVHFTGADGLDLRLGGFTARVASGRGALLADVTTGGVTREDVPLVAFPVEDFTPEDGLAALTEAPTTLTADGAEAFGSLYKAGTAMGDLGSEAGPSKAPSAGPAESPAARPAAAESGSRTSLAVGGGAVLLVALAAVLFTVHRRRTGPDS